jgi:hypothetical protein
MKKNEIIRLDWETNNEFNYRIETGRIIFSVGTILKNLETISKSSNKNFSELPGQLKKQQNKLIGLMIPERYTKVQEFLVNCLKSYIRAGNFLDEGTKIKDAALTYKSGRYIKEGNAWMELAKIRIYESIEKEVSKNAKN